MSSSSMRRSTDRRPRHCGDPQSQWPACAIKQALPACDIQAEGLGEGVVLLGNVSNPIESQTAFDIAARLVDDPKKVVNSINVHGRDQVMLK